VPQIRVGTQVGLESEMVIGMDHFMRHDILQHVLFLDPVGAQKNAILVVEATELTGLARPAADVVLSQIPAQPLDVVAHESDDWRGFEQMIPLFLASPTVDRAVSSVGILPILVLSFSRHLARRHAIKVFEPRRQIIVGKKIGTSMCGRRPGFVRIRHHGAMRG